MSDRCRKMVFYVLLGHLVHSQMHAALCILSSAMMHEQRAITCGRADLWSHYTSPKKIHSKDTSSGEAAQFKRCVGLAILYRHLSIRLPIAGLPVVLSSRHYTRCRYNGKLHLGFVFEHDLQVAHHNNGEKVQATESMSTKH